MFVIERHFAVIPLNRRFIDPQRVERSIDYDTQEVIANIDSIINKFIIDLKPFFRELFGWVFKIQVIIDFIFERLFHRV